MNAGAFLVLVLILVPVLGGLASLLLRRGPTITWTVAIVSAVVSLASVGLLAYMAVNGLTVLTIEAGAIYPMGPGLLLFGFLLLVVFLHLGWRLRSYLVLGVAVADLALAGILTYWAGFGEASPAILVDYLSLIMVLITSLIGSVIAIYSLRYMEHDLKQTRFFAAVLLFLGAMNGAVFSNDMLWLFLFWDVTTLCSFLLIGHPGTDEAHRAARRALVITFTGGLAFLVAAVLAFHYYGSISLRDFPTAGLAGLALLPLSLLAVAAFTKSAQVPFQSWLLGAMVAPTPVSALLHSATMVNLGVYLLLRLSPNFAAAPSLTWAVALVGGVSFLTASILAITQSNSKRVLAWSTVGNLGLITMCVGISTALAITAAIILLLYHAISKALMFLAVGTIKERIGSEDIEAMEGLRTTMPYASLAIFIGIITIVLPPFGMFASKWLISEAAITFPFLIFLLGLGFAAIVVFYFKWMGTILSASGGEKVLLSKDPLPRNYKWTLGSLMAGAIGLSVLIGPVLQYLIAPYVSLYYPLPVGTDNLSLFTTTGEFPVFLFLLLVAVVFIGLIYLVRPTKEEVSTPYACGENFQFESRSNYYLSEATVGRAVTVAEGAGVLLVIALVVIPIVLEVLR